MKRFASEHLNIHPIYMNPNLHDTKFQDTKFHDTNLQERQIEILFKKQHDMEEQMEELRNDYGNLYETTSQQYDNLLNDIHGIHKRFNSFQTDELKEIMRNYYESARRMDAKLNDIDYYVWLHIMIIYSMVCCLVCYVSYK